MQTKKKTLSKGDPLILTIVLLLTALGVVMVYSASAVTAAREMNNDSYFYLRRHALYAIAGIFVMLVASKIYYTRWRGLSLLIFLGCTGLMFAVFIPGIGATAGGATRWLRVGPLSIQPSELAKFAFILLSAHVLALRKEKNREKVFLFLIITSSIMIAGCGFQRDFGCAALFAFLLVVMLFVGGLRVGYLLLLGLAVLPFFYNALMSSEERISRVLAFLNPWDYKFERGYHLCESLISFGSGGVGGLGLGSGKQKLMFLPFAHNDFIFAIIGQELGFTGVMGIIFLFGVLTLRGMGAALRSRNAFGFYLGFGITILIATEALLNMCVAMGLVPTKGMNLPYISYGGTALMVSLVGAGILANIYSNARSEEGRK